LEKEAIALAQTIGFFLSFTPAMPNTVDEK